MTKGSQGLAGQVAAALILIACNMRVQFVDPPWAAVVLSLLWVVGVTNAINLSDSAEAVLQKCKQMFTDPQRLTRKDPGRPEVCNLYEFHKLLSPPDAEFAVCGIPCAELHHDGVVPPPWRFAMPRATRSASGPIDAPRAPAPARS